MLARGRRVFGGAGGLWFRKKSSKSIAQTAACLSDENKEMEKVELKECKKDEDEENKTSASATVAKHHHELEWDEVRCRPVYEGFTNTTESLSALNPDPYHHHGNDGEDALDEASTTASSTAATPCSINTSSTSSLSSTGATATAPTPWVLKDEKRIGARRKKQTYSTKKRRVTPFVFSPPYLEGSKRIRIENIRPQENSPELSGTTTLNQPPISPNSENKEAVDSASSLMATDTTETTVAPSQSPTTQQPLESKSKPKHALLEANQELAQEEEELNFREAETVTPPQQPSSLTSVSGARNFFQYLDSQHPLHLEDNSKKAYDVSKSYSRETLSKKIEGRSMRRIDLHNNPILAREFGRYQNHCQNVGVSPLPWEHFMKQRRVHHTAVYEGILDDD